MNRLNVGSVLRSSKLASFDPQLNQVYTQDPKTSSWGGIIKSPLPAQFKHKYITIQSLDSRYKVPSIKIADRKVNAVQRLTEQVPYIVKPMSWYPGGMVPGTLPYVQRFSDDPMNLAELSTRQFAAYLKSVSARPANVVVDPKSNHRNYAKAHGHVYTHLTQDDDKPRVFGRILQQYKTLSTVGIAGFVVFHESGRHGSGRNMHPSRHVQEFSVDQLLWDAKGRLVMKVTASQLVNNRKHLLRNTHHLKTHLPSANVPDINLLIKQLRLNFDLPPASLAPDDAPVGKKD